MLSKWLYDKSRVRGDFHARFCERNGVKLPVPTRLEQSRKWDWKFMYFYRL